MTNMEFRSDAVLGMRTAIEVVRVKDPQRSEFRGRVDRFTYLQAADHTQRGGEIVQELEVGEKHLEAVEHILLEHLVNHIQSGLQCLHLVHRLQQIGPQDASCRTGEKYARGSVRRGVG